MSDKITPKSTSSDLSQLRNLLFGEQAQQTDDRFEMLENSINALRRENRQLRQALEVEAMTRIEADESLGNSFSNTLNTDLNQFSAILSKQASEEKVARTGQHTDLISALQAMQKDQAQGMSTLVDHLQSERQAQEQQFAALMSHLSAENTGKDALTLQLTTALDGFSQSLSAPNAGVVASAEVSDDS